METPSHEKKLVLFATAGLLASASIVYASVAGPKKPAKVESGAETRKEVKKSKCSSSVRRSGCSGYYTRTT